jgi:L-lactate dehydrogenase complex protein LldG
MKNESPRQQRATAALDEFIAALDTRLARNPHTPNPLPSQPLTELRAVTPDSDLLAVFAANATNTGMTVQRATRSTWQSAAINVLKAARVQQALLETAPGTPLDQPAAEALKSQLTTLGAQTRFTWNAVALFIADVGITPVTAAIAETGSIIVESATYAARSTSLIPRLHIAIVAASQIVGDLLDFCAARDPATMPAALTLISGPSKTADIEGILIRGVHGPADVQIILVEDA